MPKSRDSKGQRQTEAECWRANKCFQKTQLTTEAVVWNLGCASPRDLPFCCPHGSYLQWTYDWVQGDVSPLVIISSPPNLGDN